MGIWEEKRFDSFIKLNRGFDLPNDKIIQGSYPVVASTNIKGYHNEFKVKAPVVITGRSGSLGKIQYVDKNCIPLNTTLYVKDYKDNNPKFVYYYLQLMHLENFNSGAGVPTLNQNHLHSLKVKIPDLKTQEKIADILSSYDDLIENNNRRIAILEQTAQELYKEWFVRFRFPGHEQTSFENGIPKGWEVKRIGDICKTVGGGTPSIEKPEYWINGKIKWVTPTDLTRNDSIIFLDTEKRITELGLKKSSAKLLPKNTILMTSRASIGYFGLIDDNVCTNQGFISIIPNEFIYSYYLLYNLLERKEEIISRATGSTFKEISKSSFRKMKILYPSCKLVEKFYQHVDIMLKKIKTIKEQNQNLIKQRDLLLPRLMSGKLEV